MARLRKPKTVDSSTTNHKNISLADLQGLFRLAAPDVRESFCVWILLECPESKLKLYHEEMTKIQKCDSIRVFEAKIELAKKSAKASRKDASKSDRQKELELQGLTDTVIARKLSTTPGNLSKRRQREGRTKLPPSNGQSNQQ